MLFVPATVEANSFDRSRLSDGLLGITYTGTFERGIRIMVQKTGDTAVYQYAVTTNEKFYIPLQIGDGEYRVMLLRNIQGQEYSVIMSQTMNVRITDPHAKFLTASPIVNFRPNSQTIRSYTRMLHGIEDNRGRLNAVYVDLVETYSYDHEKANNIPANYVPVIDEIYRSRLAICYDYSAVFASVLRYKGIPTRLVMGFAPGIAAFHAWNEVYIDGRWIVIDTTYDSAFFHAGHPYSMEKDGSLFRVVRVY